MSTYYYMGSGVSQANLKNTGTLASHLIYVTPTQFGFLNDDGSKTYVTGTNFVFDAATGQFTSGTVTSYAHYTASGQFIEQMTGITDQNALYSVTSLLSGLLPAADAMSGLLMGDDLIDTRYHVANGIIDDLINAGAGNDTVYSGDGVDRVHGDAGNDVIYAGAGNDFVFGDIGNDQLFGEDGNDVMSGGLGENWLSGGNGVDTAVFNGKFSDLKITVSATETTVKSYDNTLDHLVGIERIAADDGTYQFNATTNSWALVNTVGGTALIDPDKVLYGTAGADAITFAVQGQFGANGKFVVNGLAGNDTIRLSSTYAPVGVQVTAYGGDGNDKIDATRSQGSVVVYGDAGNDILIGGNAFDTLEGGAGNDVLADYQRERFIPGISTGIIENILNGGAGTDTAVFGGKLSDLKIVVGTAGMDVTTFDGKLTDHLYGVERIATDDGVFQYNTATNSWTNISASIGVANGATLLNAGAVQNGTATADVIAIANNSTNYVINGLAGDDSIVFNAHFRVNDPHPFTVYAGAGNDIVDAGIDNIVSVNIYGGDGNDTLSGSDQGSRIDGGTGNDSIKGGAGDDLLSGGAGTDTFIFAVTNVGSAQQPRYVGFGHDAITDFAIGTDHLTLSGILSSSAVIQDTSDGLLVSFGNTSYGDILLSGVHSTTATAADLFI
jgi:Ca2+-binding RTX toxin-like protein